MTFGFRPDRVTVAAAVAIATTLGFVGCTPTPELLVWSTDSLDFRGSGDWRLSSDGNAVILRFLEATNDGLYIEPTARRPDFTSGTIRFEDPEQTSSLEFRLTN